MNMRKKRSLSSGCLVNHSVSYKPVFFYPLYVLQKSNTEMNYTSGGTDFDMLCVRLFGFWALSIVYARNLKAGRHVGQKCTRFTKM